MLYFILNPSSRSSGSGSVWNVIAARLENENIPYRVYATKYRGHGRDLARSITEKDPRAAVVAVGGDGSIHDILCGLSNLSTVTFAVIPSGSGNDFARGMELPAKTKDAIEAVLNPKKYCSMDVGTLNAQRAMRFGVSSGIGFDASICHEALNSKIKDFLNKLRLGSLTYSLLALKQIVAYRPCKMKITIEDSLGKTEVLRFEKAFFASAMNQPCEGGGLFLTPEADASDGLIDLFVCADMPRLKLAAMLPTAYSGKHTKLKGLCFRKCRSIRIEADRKLPVHADGESAGYAKSLTYGLEKERLKVITG